MLGGTVPEEVKINPALHLCHMWSSFRRSPSTGSLNSRDTFLGVERLEAFSSLSLFATEDIIFNCPLRGRLPLTVKKIDRAGIISLPSRVDVFLSFIYFRVRWVFVAAQTFLQLWRAGLLSCCRARALGHVVHGLSPCNSQALELGR